MSRACISRLRTLARASGSRYFCFASTVRCLGSEQLAELFNGQAGVTDNAAHRVGVDGVVARDSDPVNAVRHDDVLPLPGDPKAGLYQGTHRVQVVDAGEAGHRQI